MNKQKGHNTRERTREFKKKDTSYSVDQRGGMTIGELVDGIRDKIQGTLEKKVSEKGNYNQK